MIWGVRIGVAAVLAALAVPSAATEPPAIRANGRATQLYVDGKPFIVLGGEVDNSLASSPAAMAPAWDRVAAMGANLLFVPVGWDQIEPREGAYDFAIVDDAIAQARRHGMSVGLLWLGAFKNARSTYAPTWVRADRRRFPRAATAASDAPTGAFVTTRAPVLSAFTPELARVDGRAFAAFLAHVGSIDPDHRVVLVQVENETGILGDSRDRSPAAEAAWRAPVPAALTGYLAAHAATLTPEIAALWTAHGRRRDGTWVEVFGASPAADEAFMAWHFARYVEAVARAGRAVSALPFYTNAWLGPEPGEPNPGDYPSGGPIAAMLDVWKAGAPTLALLAPDLYIDDAKAVHARYARSDNPLLMPEERFRPGDLFWALGRHAAIGQSTYGIDGARPGSRLEAAYKLLAPMLPVIAAAQAEGRIAGVLIDGDEVETVHLGGYDFAVRGAEAYARRLRLDAGQTEPPAAPPGQSESLTYDKAFPDTRPAGLIVALGPNEFLFAGGGFLADPTRGGRPVEIDRIEEGTYVDGRWHAGEWLNGDEYGQVVPRAGLGATRVVLFPD